MNISRFTPPTLFGKGLQILKNETSKGAHKSKFTLGIAVAILLLFTNFFILNSCSSSSDDDDSQQQEELTAHYYVKYEISFPVISGYKPNVSLYYISEKGNISSTINSSSWNGTFGPFKAGTKVSIKASCEYGVNGHVESNARLYVCNGNGPFVLKAESPEVGARNLYVEYTIDEND